MKKTFLLFAMATVLFGAPLMATAQSGKTYQQMTSAERSNFVAAQSRRIARALSGNEYDFTPAFEKEIQQSVDHFVGKANMLEVAQRGQAHAPTLIATFRARNVSPLIGLYLPWIESAYKNIDSPNSMGSVGMFQFLPTTGAKYGLSRQELLDVNKSADAAARYIAKNLQKFKDDPMKEALALLAYNRGEAKTGHDLKSLVNDQNKQCSICALTAAREQLDHTFRDENVYYVPRFFAAAIIGENPQAFGLQTQPLSSYEEAQRSQ